MTEAVSVYIVGELALSGAQVAESDARLIAPLLAARLYPDLRLGSVIHSERADGGWEVIVQDMTEDTNDTTA